MRENSILGILEPYLEDYQNGKSLTHKALDDIFDALSTEEWAAVENILDEEGVSLDDYIGGVLEFELLIDDSQEEQSAEVEQVRRAPEQDTPEEELGSGDLLEAELKEQLAQVLDRLPEEESAVLRMHFGLEGCPKHSLEAIADELELSLDEICDLEASALRRLKDPTMRCDLEAYKNFSK